MTEYEAQLADATRRMIEAMSKHGSGSAVATILRNFLPPGDSEAACEWLITQTRRASRPVVLAFEAYGYVTAGLAGEEAVYHDPRLEGLQVAHAVFLEGINAPAVLRASDWGMTPDGMRNALKRAAEWAERRCAKLAVAIRAISVAKDGRPTFAPAHPIEVRVFSTYSEADNG